MRFIAVFLACLKPVLAAGTIGYGTTKIACIQDLAVKALSNSNNYSDLTITNLSEPIFLIGQNYRMTLRDDHENQFSAGINAWFLAERINYDPRTGRDQGTRYSCQLGCRYIIADSNWRRCRVLSLYNVRGEIIFQVKE